MKKLFGLAALMLTVVSASSLMLGLSAGAQDAMGRDRHIENELRDDRGHLHGHHRGLAREENNIQRQEARDMRQNGGFLTPREERHFNQEQNQVQHQINRDDR